MINNVCPYPWTSLYLNYDGEISPCCFHYPFANIRDGKSLQEIWNGREEVNLRMAWASGKLEGTPCENCSGLMANKKYDYPIKHLGNMPAGDYAENAMRNLKEFNARATFLQSMPVEVLYVPSTWCNLNCIHCCQPRYDKTLRTFMSMDLIGEFYHTFGFMAVRHLLSGGEPLGRGPTYKLLEQMPQKQKTASELVVLTNGLLISKVWARLAGFGHYSFEISIASLRQQVYEKIHHKANLDVLLSNLEFLNKARQGKSVKLVRIMALMKSNFLDLAGIIPAIKKYRFDETWILPVHASDGRHNLLVKENIFGLPHLIIGDKNWQFLLDHVLTEIKQARIQPTLNHLEYVDSLLPKSKGKAYIMSTKTMTLWPFRVMALNLSQSPRVRRFIKRVKAKL